MYLRRKNRLALSGLVTPFVLTLGLLLPGSEARAYCTDVVKRYAFLDPETCAPDREIFVYINDDEVSIARVGLDIDDIERLVRAVLAAYNESSVALPRLTYGGRVSHNTLRLPGKQHATYQNEWATAEPSKPLGITIQAVKCRKDSNEWSQVVDAIASGSQFGPKAGFGQVTFTAFWDDNEVVCQRTGKGVVEDISVPADPDPSDTACNQDGEWNTEDDKPIPCTCNEGPQGQHECQLKNSIWSGCLCTGRGYEAYNLGDGTAHPLEPPYIDRLGPSGTKDFAGVLIHELGHVLGMGHAEDAAKCAGVQVGDGNGQGVMRSTAWSFQLSRGRRMHADDLEGLRNFFYDQIQVPWKRDYLLTMFESSDHGMTWAPSVGLPVMGARTRPAASSAVDNSGFQVIAFSDSADRVMHVTRVDDTFHNLSPQDAQVPLASTHFPVAAAYGDGRLMIAWIDDPTLTDFHSDIRWAIRDMDATPPFVWDTGSYWEQSERTNEIVQKEIGLGFDPGTGLFIIAAIRSTDNFGPEDFPESFDGRPLFIGVDPVTAGVFGGLFGGVVFDEPGTPIVRSIGKPACHLTDPSLFFAPSHCAVPVVAALPGGPEAHVLYAQFTADLFLSVTAILQPIAPSPGVVSHGLVDLAIDPRDRVSPDFVGAWSTAADAPPDAPVQFDVFRTQALVPPDPPAALPEGVEPVLAVDIDPAPGATPSPVVPAWPAAIGSQWSGRDVVFSAWRVDAAQVDQDPTEGAGTDGTPVVCVEETTTSGSATASDTAEPPPDDDCECSANSRGVPLSGLAGLLLALGRRRQRRPSRLDKDAPRAHLV